MKEYTKPKITCRRFCGTAIMTDSETGISAETRAKSAMTDSIGGETMSAYIVRDWGE